MRNVKSSEIWEQVLSLAQLAADAGEVPVGCVVVHDSQIIASAYNQVERLQDATAHAEMLALRQAAKTVGTKALNQCDLYVSLEPCAMCAGAIAHTRIARLYFGAYDIKAGAVEHGVRLFSQPTTHHHPEVYGGFFERECGDLLRNFFAQQRHS